MGDSSQYLGPALTVAGSRLSRGPAFAAAVCSGDPGHPARRGFLRHPAVRAWLRAQRYDPDAEQDRLEWLLDRAEAWLRGGEAQAVIPVLARRLADGTVAKLKPTDRAVHRAVFALAVLDGARVLAGGDYLATLMRVDFGVTVTGRAVRDALHRLHDRGLLALLPATAWYASNRANLTFYLVPTSSASSPNIMAELTVSHDAALALLSTRMEAQQRRAAGQGSAGAGSGASGPAPGPPPTSVGDLGSNELILPQKALSAQ